MDASTFIQEFQNIKNMGWVDSHRHGDTGIGKTLEDLMKIRENNHQTYDLHGYEIKAHRNASNSLITLFTKSPTYPKNANNFLREKYGVQEDSDTSKILHTSIYANDYNTHRSGYNFKLEVTNNYNIILNIKNNNDNIVSNCISWDIEKINYIIENKIKHLAFIKADRRIYNNTEQFKYDSCILYSGITIHTFIDAIINKFICVELRLGYYKSGKYKNKTHDHGTGFRINPKNLSQIYPDMTTI